LKSELSLGQLIKQTRKNQNKSQKELCQNLCSQSMLSAIENNKHIPNGELLVELCQRLGIDLNYVSLHSHYIVSEKKQLNQKIHDLCNNHEYEELYQVLMSEETLNSIENEFEYASYYYYLGCTLFQLEHNIEESEKMFHLALAEKQAPANMDSLTRLVYAKLGLIYALKKQEKQSMDFFSQSLSEINEEPFQENFGIIFYLKALAEMRLQKNSSLVRQTITAGIQYITAHKSVYMLANLYYLAYLADEEATRRLTAKSHSELFQELYGEKVYTEISEY
jgi:transcriptional regulator with XRE-family HTH domain